MTTISHRRNDEEVCSALRLGREERQLLFFICMQEPGPESADPSLESALSLT